MFWHRFGPYSWAAIWLRWGYGCAYCTLLPSTHVPEADYEAVAKEFGPAEIGALVALIVAINAWNRIGVATRSWEPGSYRP